MCYFVAHPKYQLHKTSDGHPENPLRVSAIEHALQAAGLKTSSNTLTPKIATDADLLLCHTPDYLQLVQDEIQLIKPKEISLLSTGDTQISAGSLDAALLAAGGVLTGIDHIMKDSDSKVFCIVRPPGHHACSNKGMGFCIFNNVAIGARYAQQKYGIGKVLIADWDVHHGNGTQEIFYEDPTVFYFSTHEHGLYPGTGTVDEIGIRKGIGTTCNHPIFPGKKSRVDVIEAFENSLMEKMKKFRPDLVLISAGFDAHELDPLGHFNLTNEDFGKLTHILKLIAQEYAEGRLVSVLEGGYHLQALANSSIAHVKALNN